MVADGREGWDSIRGFLAQHEQPQMIMDITSMMVSKRNLLNRRIDIALLLQSKGFRGR